MFSINFTTTVEDSFKKAKEVVDKSGGVIIGTHKVGFVFVKTIVGEVRCSYEVNDQRIDFNVVQKPTILTEDMLKKRVEEIFI